MSNLPEHGSSIELIAAERRRQIMEEGWDSEHDDQGNNDHQLARAAACYCMTPLMPMEVQTGEFAPYQGDLYWPWDSKWWKPVYNDEEGSEYTEARIRELTKAGALIAAEIDRLQRKLQREKE